MRDGEAGVILGEDILDVVGRLRRLLDGVGAGRDELDRVLGAEDDAEERRHDGVDAVGNGPDDELRPSFLLVAERLAEVVLGRLRAVLRDRKSTRLNSSHPSISYA